MYKEMLRAICEGVSEEVAKEIFIKITADENTASNFDPKKPLTVPTIEEKNDKDKINGKLFNSDHEARSFLRANGYKEDGMGTSWIKGTNVCHILFRTHDERFKAMTGSVSRSGYEIVMQ